MSFAPYQDIDPSTERALSPPPRNRTTSPKLTSPRGSFQASRGGITSPQRVASPPPVSSQHDVERGFGNMGSGGSSRREEMDPFETRLGLRMDYEACLAYLALPPAGGVLLLILEYKSDYVRFHAWQSSLLFTFLFVVHVIFSWTAIISWMLFVADLGLIGLLTFRAYKDADTLDRFEIPFFGQLASQILDDE